MDRPISPLLTVSEAKLATRQCVQTLPSRRVRLAESLGLILAEDVVADLDLPPFDKSLVDGFAFRSEDAKGTGAHRFREGEEILAGQVPSKPLGKGEAASITTGAPMPEGADAVVMIEKVESVENEIVFFGEIRPGQNVLKRAREMKAGEVVLNRGRRLSPAEIGLLASVGCVEPKVVPRPRVVVIPTGNELVEPDQRPGPGQIRNSNAAMIVSLARDAGAAVESRPIASDDEESLRMALKEGLDADILIVTGGVSAGKKDLVPATLEGLGVARVFHKVSVRPGKPIWFGTGPEREDRHATLVFGLPGNPGSGIVGFELFVRPAIEALLGLPECGSRRIEARLETPFEHRGDRPTYHPAIRLESGLIRPLDWAGSADLRTIARADGFAVFPAGDRSYDEGEIVEFLPIRAGAR